MPWEIRRGTSQCSGYGVFKEGTSELEGCHTTREAAQRQMAALYASEPEAAQKDVITNEVTPNRYPDYIGPKKKKKKVNKQMSLYDMLTPEEKAFHDALVSIAEQYGPFDQGTSSIWVGYETARENEDAEIGVKCSNCSFFNPENNGCAILSYAVEPEGKCRLAAIPDGLVNPDMDEDDDDMDMEDFVEDMMERIGKSMNEDLKEAMEILKSLEKGYKDKEKSMHEDDMEDDDDEEMKEKGYKGKKNKSIDSDSAQQTDVPSDLSSIFTNMPRHAKRVNTTGNAPVNFTFLQGDK